MKKLFVFLFITIVIFYLNGCKNGAATYDITGNWRATLTFSDQVQETYFFTFTGSSSSGVVTHSVILYPGEYTVNGNNVNFSFEYVLLLTRTTETYTGSFDSANQMSGNFQWETTALQGSNPPVVWETGTWQATRQ
jgi:hypothetical protein